MVINITPNKVMELVEEELREDPRTRDSDKFLIWKILIAHGIHIDYSKFMDLPCFESITRCRRKMQQDYPELQGNQNIKQFRNEKMNMFRFTINGENEEVSQTF